MIVLNKALQIFCSDKINDDGYFSGFAERTLGDGRDLSNVIKFLDKHKIHYRQLVVLEQIHSANIVFVSHKTDKTVEKIPDTDGVITDQTGVVLTIRTADCLPLIFADKKLGAIGISHQGWRGSLKKMAVKMVAEFIKRGSRAENIFVALGPSIGACCYDIIDDRYYQFSEEFDGYSDKIFHFEKGKRHLNIALLNYLLLTDVGIKKEQIDFFPFCTSCDMKRFFSLRRHRKKEKEYGEMFSFVIHLISGVKSVNVTT